MVWLKRFLDFDFGGKDPVMAIIFSI